MSTGLAHTLLIALGIAAYTALTALGHDGNAVLTAVLGYAGAAGISKATGATNAGDSARN